MIRTHARAAVVAATLAWLASAASADEPARPWADGVPEAEQSAALDLFNRANELFSHNDYAAAAAIYREALSHWDHPAIHGNLATAMVHLDDPLVAYHHVELALRWGKAPFEPHVYEQIITNRKLLLGQLARIEVDCDVPGAKIALNGETLFVGPGSHKTYVRAGAQQVVAAKPDHLTFTRQFQALPGQVTRVVVELVPLSEAGRYERRWKPWKPWAVAGAGVAVVAVGVGLELSAKSNIDEFEAEIARSCPDGCAVDELPPAVLALEDSGRTRSKIAVSAFVVGGAAVATGAVMLYLNRPRRVHLDSSGQRIGVAPVVAPGMAGAVLTGEF